MTVNGVGFRGMECCGGLLLMTGGGEAEPEGEGATAGDVADGAAPVR